jgi:hypothetical protein
VVVFGGELWPLGNGVAFVELPLADAIAAYREGLNPPPTLAHLGVLPIIDLMATLPPLQMPYKRRLLVGTTSNWTTIFDNSRGGGDPYSHARLATAHGVRAVAARHAPETQTALPATQFHLLGPTGEPPLMYVRTIDAGRFDSGRWEFLTSGTPQPFEDTDAYERSRVRDRFTREMLLNYLRALGIRADDPDFYSEGVLATDTGNWSPGWRGTLDDVRAERR